MADGKKFRSQTVTDVTEFMRLARERYTYALAVDKIDRDEAAEDVRFVAGDQWHEEARKAREAADRPVLTENRLGIYTAQVVNDGRQSKPAIRLTPMDGGTKETAEMLQGRIRHIEYETDADIAYDQAREHQVTSGRGFIRVTTRYKKKSRQQELRIEPISNQFSVLWDPDAREYDKSDAEWWFVLTVKSKDKFKRDHGASEIVANNFYTDIENPAPEWVGVGANGGSVQVAEYWLKEHKQRECCQLATGATAWADELNEADQAFVTDRWQEDDVAVRQYIIDGVEIHDETKWIGSTIPIIPLWGKELTVEGKRRTYSLVRFAKDPQRLVNLYVSNIAEQIAQMPKNPYLAAEGQTTNHEEEWENINNTPTPVVHYRPVVVTVNGQQVMVPMPHRETNEPPIQALTVGLNQAIDAMKAAMGIFDASLGNRGNETSGIAIQRRAKEADNANFHFHDNEARSRKALGRVLLELIPIVDAGEKTVMTRSEDGKTKPVKVNTPLPYRDEESGEMVHHQLSQGEYAPAVSTGPSFTSQRQEAFDTYSQIANSDKNFMGVAGDILFRNLDAPGSDQIADRYEQGVIPPQLRPQKPGQQQPQIPPQVQAQLQGYAQMVDQLTNTVHQQAQVIEQKTIDSQTKKWIASLGAQVELTKLQATLNSKGAETMLQAEMAKIGDQLAASQAAFLQRTQQDHEAGLASADRQHQQTMQAGDQQHQVAMAQQSQDALQAAVQPTNSTEEQQP